MHGRKRQCSAGRFQPFSSRESRVSLSLSLIFTRRAVFSGTAVASLMAYVGSEITPRIRPELLPKVCKEDRMDRLHRISAAVLAFVLVIALTLASTSALQRTAHTAASVVGTPVSLGEIVVEDEKEHVSKEEILWLARVIYSETKRPDEQELVAWVVRNRVETGYRGNSSYKDAVLDKYQFSAFIPNTSTRRHYTSLDWNSQAKGFQTALSIAQNVAAAGVQERPFSETTRHFYSARSMAGGKAPAWAQNKRPVKLDRHVEADRFRFYEQIA